MKKLLVVNCLSFNSYSHKLASCLSSLQTRDRRFNSIIKYHDAEDTVILNKASKLKL